MKKKIVLVLALLFGILSLLNASGITDIRYVGTTTQYNPYDFYTYALTFDNNRGSARCYPVSKITKEESRLLWQGLNRYNYKVGEIYSVCMYTDRLLKIVAEIKEDGSCSWYAYEITF